VYNGTERRTSDSGRRTSDRDFCAVHHFLQDESKERREVMCNKIKSLKTEHDADILRLDGDIDKVDKRIETIYDKIDTFKDLIIGKYWFRIVIGGICACLIYIAAENRFYNTEQTSALKGLAVGQKEIMEVVNNIENNQIIIKEKVRLLEETHKDK
jgi:hypothetical protein